jgi:hypothetical protein
MGMDTVSSGVLMPPGYSIYSYDVIGSTHGLRTRLGWREWVTGIGEQVRSLLPYTGSTSGGASDRLFACTSTGIWDVSSSWHTTVPVGVAVTADNFGGSLFGTYYFVVTAILSGVEGPPSVEVSATIPLLAGQFFVECTPVAGAQSYRAYYGLAPGAYTNYTEVASTGMSPQYILVDSIGLAGTPPPAPTPEVTFPTQNAASGWGISTGFVNSAGVHYLVYCDEANGVYTYRGDTSVWTQGGLPGTPITGVDPAELVFVMAWKNRLWFVERDTASGWYLDIGAVTGPAVKFNFGARFKAGGELRGLWSWTYDGGAGIDDALVAVSGGGDVVIYRGTDPAFAETFALTGVWFAGTVPAGRKICTDFGGELLLMSSTGIQSLAKLTAGGGGFSTQYETYRISNLFNEYQNVSGSLPGWYMVLHPEDAALMVNAPSTSGAPTQLVMSTVTKGWHEYRSLPAGVCSAPWDGWLFMGTDDGRVIVNTGDVDGVLFADPNAYSPIYWSVLTGFTNMGRPTNKQIHFLRPTLLSRGGSIPHEIAARYRWDLEEIAAISATPTPSGSLWGTALWDAAVWGGSFSAAQPVHGAYGIGPEVAIAIRGAASSRMTWTGTDVCYEEGGFL